MSKKVIIQSTVKKGAMDKLLPFLQDKLPAVRGFKGCMNVTVFLDKKSGVMVFDEEWLSTDAHQAYINTIAQNGVLEELVSYIEAPPEIKYLDRLDM